MQLQLSMIFVSSSIQMHFGKTVLFALHKMFLLLVYFGYLDEMRSLTFSTVLQKA